MPLITTRNIIPTQILSMASGSYTRHLRYCLKKRASNSRWFVDQCMLDTNMWIIIFLVVGYYHCHPPLIRVRAARMVRLSIWFGPSIIPNFHLSSPGRFFAAMELKAMVAHLILNYDVKLENEGVRPPDTWLGAYCVPNQKAKMLFRKRQN